MLNIENQGIGEGVREDQGITLAHARMAASLRKRSVLLSLCDCLLVCQLDVFKVSLSVMAWSSDDILFSGRTCGARATPPSAA